MTSELTHISRLALVGCGKMGGALLEGWLRLGLAASAVAVIDPHLPDGTGADLRKRGVSVNLAMQPAEIVVIAVKPQALDAVLPSLRPLLRPSTLVISVVAGKTMAQFATGLGEAAAIIRTIPNTPAAVGRGITVGVANERVTIEQRALAAMLLGAVGQFEWMEDEALMNAVTAVSGSGPAYVFHLVEALAAAGVAQGLPADLAAKLARATVEGAGELLHQSTLGPATLRQNVTSPGGTTAAALYHLMDGDSGFAPLLAKAIAAATARGQELAG